MSRVIRILLRDSSPPLFQGGFNQDVPVLIMGHLPIRHSFLASAQYF